MSAQPFSGSARHSRSAILCAMLMGVCAPGVVHAATCDGQKGAVIFEDTFTDDLGGWDGDADLLLGKGQAIVHLDPKYESSSYLNSTFSAGNADFCVVAVAPTAVADKNNAGVGITFWATDNDNYFLWEVLSDGTAAFWKRSAGKWSQVGPSLKSDVAVGSDVALRVVASAGVLSLQVNGVELKKTRAPMPSGDPRFGIYAETEEDPPKAVDFVFKSYRVTNLK